MRHLTPLLCLVLSGCASWFTDESPEVTEGGQGVVDAYADKGDLVMSRAAASVEVARVANKNGSPAVVEAELGVAAIYLPKPTVADLNFAKDRAAKADPQAYAKAQAVADAQQRELDALWNKVEQEKQKAKAALEAKQLELDAAQARMRELIWAGIGAAIILAGLSGLVWGSAIGITKIEAVAVIGTGVGVGSLPSVLESDKAPWVLVPLAGLIALRLVLWIWQQAKPKAKPVINHGINIDELMKSHPDEKTKNQNP